MNFLSCGDCTACCDGNLIGNAYGVKFGNNISCSFLINKKCSIYSVRPSVCKKYQCAWTQGLFPDWMKPNISGVLASVENNQNCQFLRIVKIHTNVDQKVFDFLDTWCKNNNTYYIISGDNNENKHRIWIKKD